MKCVIDISQTCDKFPYDHYFKLKDCLGCQTIRKNTHPKCAHCHTELPQLSDIYDDPCFCSEECFEQFHKGGC